MNKGWSCCLLEYELSQREVQTGDSEDEKELNGLMCPYANAQHCKTICTACKTEIIGNEGYAWGTLGLFSLCQSVIGPLC